MRVLFQHIVQEKIASIGDLQAMCRDYTYYGWFWKKFKPSKLILEKDNLNQNAMQSPCLMLNLPFILSDFRFELDHWSTRMRERNVNRVRELINSICHFGWEQVWIYKLNIT